MATRKRPNENRRSLLVRLWRFLTGRRLNKSSELARCFFEGKGDDETLSASSISPVSSGRSTVCVDSFIDHLSTIDEDQEVTLQLPSPTSTGTASTTATSESRRFHSIYALIEELVNEHDGRRDDEKTIASARTKASVLSSSIFSTATPFCVFSDDGSVTIDGKPFITVHRRCGYNNESVRRSSPAGKVVKIPPRVMEEPTPTKTTDLRATSADELPVKLTPLIFGGNFGNMMDL